MSQNEKKLGFFISSCFILLVSVLWGLKVGNFDFHLQESVHLAKKILMILFKFSATFLSKLPTANPGYFIYQQYIALKN
jgi:hypothetical protein